MKKCFLKYLRHYINQDGSSTGYNEQKLTISHTELYQSSTALQFD